jgi:protein-ribulosamine 3-kinase
MSDAAIRAGLATIVQSAVLPAPAQRIEGGCINQCFRYETTRGPIFVKVAMEDSLDVLEAEAASLQALRAAGAIRVPQILGVSAIQERALLALEWIDLQRTTPSSDARLGEQLAVQHRITKPLYGFKRNTI